MAPTPHLLIRFGEQLGPRIAVTLVGGGGGRGEEWVCPQSYYLDKLVRLSDDNVEGITPYYGVLLRLQHVLFN